MTSAAAQPVDATGCFTWPTVAAEGPRALAAASARTLAEHFAVMYFKVVRRPGHGEPASMKIRTQGSGG